MLIRPLSVFPAFDLLPTMQYRPEIDGLRSFAILPVILFHAGFGWIPGGFLGVDVFFVISGYLITSILIKESTTASFSLLHFYERRARRILPALFFVLSFSTLAAWFILSPNALVQFAESLIASVSFVANIYFWLTTNYFNADTTLKPLVHIWSLGIEEQFYFLFPLLFILFWSKKKRLYILLSLCFILSVISADLTSHTDPNRSFYLLHTRAWELLAGAFCAFYLANRASPPTNIFSQFASATGLLAVVISFIVISQTSHHPGLITLLPVLGSVFIILYANPSTWTARLLSLKPFVWIGLLSYSAYLWHQPLFAFTRFITFSPTLNLQISLLLVLLTFALAWLSWRFVEKPFRNRQFLSRKQIFISSLLAILTTVCFASYVIKNKGFINQYNPIQQILLEFENTYLNHALQADDCFLAPHEDSSLLGERCKISKEKPMALLGDSHGSAIWYGLVKKFPLARYSASGCAPIRGEQAKAWWPSCPAVNEFNFKEIENKQPEAIFLHANWQLRDLRIDSGEENIIGTSLHDTILYLQRIASKTKIIVIGDVPQWPPSLITLLTQHAEQGLPDDWIANDSYLTIKKTEDKLRQEMPENVLFISLLDLLCKPTGDCLALVPTENPVYNKAPITWDYGHLSRDGADYVTGLIEPRIRDYIQFGAVTTK